MPGPVRMARKSPKRVVTTPMISHSHHDPTFLFDFKGSTIGETPRMTADRPRTSARERAVTSGQTNATRPLARS